MSHPQGGSVHPDSAAADARTDGWVAPEFSRYEVPDPGRWRALVVTQFAAFMASKPPPRPQPPTHAHPQLRPTQ